MQRLLQLFDCVRQVHHFCSEMCDERLQLFDGVKLDNLDGLCVWIEAHLEGSRHGGHPLAELLLGILEALGHEVDWLILLVLVGLDSGGGWVEWTVLRLVAHSMQQLSVGGQESSAISFDLIVFFAQAELNCKPVNLFRAEENKISDKFTWQGMRLFMEELENRMRLIS